MTETKDEKKAIPTTLISVLFARPEFSAEQLRLNYRADWGTEIPKTDVGEENATLMTMIDGMMVSVHITPVPIEDGAAERQAMTNYLWPEAVETAKAHTAYVTVAVQHRGQEPLVAASLAVRFAASLLSQAAASGVLTSGTFMSPEFYRTSALADCRAGRVPVMNLVYFGLYPHEDGQSMNGYTFGLAPLGAREVEVIRSLKEPREIFDMMVAAASFMLDNHVLLKDGGTIGLRAGEAYPVTVGPGRAVSGESFKIGY